MTNQLIARLQTKPYVVPHCTTVESIANPTWKPYLDETPTPNTPKNHI